MNFHSQDHHACDGDDNGRIGWEKKGKNQSNKKDSYHLIKFFKFQDGIKDFPFEGFILIGDGKGIEKLYCEMFLVVIWALL